MSRIPAPLLPVLDILLCPVLYPAAVLMKAVRRLGVGNLKRCRAILRQVGVFPIRDHYYEPLFDPKHLRFPLSEDRPLPGIDWNTEEQLALLESFSCQDEVQNLGSWSRNGISFKANSTFGPGDVEFWYSIIRTLKPSAIVEVGSGNSTIVASIAVERNRTENGSYSCKQVCIEPYEAPWLERLGIEVVRRRVECLDVGLFQMLGPRDILFIDSSHVIRPQGDVLCEMLEILPTLRSGVIVHFHDIFSPKDYPTGWVSDEVRLWNEQYLLEAFLTDNREWSVIGALHYLHHCHHERLAAKCPSLRKASAPGSFYLQKRPEVTDESGTASRSS